MVEVVCYMIFMLSKSQHKRTIPDKSVRLLGWTHKLLIKFVHSEIITFSSATGELMLVHILPPYTKAHLKGGGEQN